MNENLSLRREGGLRDARLPDEPLFTGDNFVAAGSQANRHQEGRDQPQWNTHGEGCDEVDTPFRDGRIHEQQTTEREQYDSTNGEHAVTGEFRFRGEK